MRRRDFNYAIAALSAVPAIANEQKTHEGSENPHASIPTGPPQQVAMVIYPQMTALDFLGPQTFLSALGNIEVHTVWKDTAAVKTDSGLQLLPSTTFSKCPQELDVLFIGGGSRGTLALMQDAETLDFLADRGRRAKYVTSVCTGSLVLGAAGLLRGYKATSHWAFRDVLSALGATPTPGRVVEDRNRITAGGVTAGIDFGLGLAAKLRSHAYAEMLQLAFEYDPHPPFHAGTPETAPKMIDAHMRSMYDPLRKQMTEAARAASNQWKS